VVSQKKENNMRIISDFRDFYDNVCRRMFPEDRLIYHRKRYVTNVKRYWTEIFSTRRMYSIPKAVHSHGIFFIGNKIFPFLVKDETKGMTVDSVIHYNSLRLKKDEKEYFDYLNSISVSSLTTRENIIKYICSPVVRTPRKEIVESGKYQYFEEDRKDTIPVENIAFIPIILMYAYGHSGWDVVLNPLLKSYQVERVINQYEICQYVDRFLWNVVQPEETINQCSDEDLQKAKGFTHKYSFRKEPENKK
jgi:hypothetical protein